MALKSSTGKVYMLFNACIPDNENIQKKLWLQEILESKYYRELSLYKNAKVLMNDADGIYSKKNLASLDSAALNNIKNAIPYAESAIDAINKIKRFADINSIDLSVKPDFTSKDSLLRIINQAKKVTEYENFTNIPDDDIYGIFDPQMVTGLDETYNQLTVEDLNRLTEIIPVKLKGKKYCVSSKQVVSMQNEFNGQIAEIENEKALFKKAKKKKRITKAYVTGGYLLSILAFDAAFGSAALPVMIGISGIAWIVYMIKG